MTLRRPTVSRALKRHKAFAVKLPAKGYEHETTWAFLDPHTATQCTFDFSEWHKKPGPIVPDLVDAAKRLEGHQNRSVRGRSAVLNWLFEYLVKANLKPKATDLTDQILVDAVTSRGLKGHAPSVVHGKLRSIVNEALRLQNVQLKTIYDPFAPERLAAQHSESLSREQREAILQAAMIDVRRIWDEFERARSAEATSAMTSVAKIATENGGFLPIIGYGKNYKRLKKTKAMRALWALKARERRAGRPADVRTFDRWLYATVESLLPFLIVIAYKLAGNVYSLLESKRDLLRDVDDVIRGSRCAVSFYKPRARRILTHMLNPAGRFSVPSLIKQVLAMTDPLVPLVPEAMKNRLFICFNRVGNSKGKPQTLKSTPGSMRRWCQRHNLMNKDGTPLTFTLDMLRPTKINDVYEDSGGDLLLAYKVANHKVLSTTYDYLKGIRAADLDRTSITDAQGQTLQHPPNDAKNSPETDRRNQNLVRKGPEPSSETVLIQRTHQDTRKKTCARSGCPPSPIRTLLCRMTRNMSRI